MSSEHSISSEEQVVVENSLYRLTKKTQNTNTVYFVFFKKGTKALTSEQGDKTYVFKEEDLRQLRNMIDSLLPELPLYRSQQRVLTDSQLDTTEFR